MKNAILFLVFNRPELTKKVFGAIRLARPPRLYISADGPRSNVSDDSLNCDMVKRVISKIDWPCDVKTLFHEHNLGCKKAVSNGIDWFFNNEEQGIILEDDIFPIPSFFNYCEELLDYYKKDNRVAMISGNNLISKRININESYLFSHYGNIWGWGTWRRAWQHYDVNMKTWPNWRDTNELSQLSDGIPFFEAYWHDYNNSIYKGKIDTWDFQWYFTCWRIGGLCIIPKYNQTYNLGFDKNATHTSGKIPDYILESQPQNLDFPLIHPKNIERNRNADILISKRVFKISLLRIFKNKIRRSRIIGPLLSKIKKIIFKLY